MLHARRNDILNQLISLSITNYQAYGLDTPFAKTAQCCSTTIVNPKLPITNYESPVSNLQFSNSLISSLANADIPSTLTAAQKLAGLGIGLTPAGDDFILGAVLAAWIIHPSDVASVLAEEITNIAAPLTTSLSAAWLRSSGKGEAGILWHNFFNALSLPISNLQSPITNLLSIGHTSGADALAGFIGTFISYAESKTKLCHS